MKIRFLILSFVFTGFNMYAQNASKLNILDTRNTNELPNAYAHGIYGDFKQTSSIGAPGASVYGGLVTIAPWYDASGNKAHQLFFNDGGIFYRVGSQGNVLNPPTGWESWQKVLVENANGAVSIATTNLPSGYKLAVGGKIIAEELKVKVQSAGWPDYVFHTSYKLMPLSQVENFIKTKGHLPEVPSATEVTEKGIAVGTNQALLLKKIEELTLYIIEQNKKIEQLTGEVDQLKNDRKQETEARRKCSSKCWFQGVEPGYCRCY